MEVGGKSLVVFYSLEGNTKVIANTIAEVTGATLLELKPIKDVSSSGFSKYIWGGKQVVFKEKPQLQPFNIDPNAYDTIIFGTPVWAGSYAPALNTFLNQFPLKNKRIGIFSCFGGSSGKTHENIKNIIPQNTFIGDMGFKEPKKNNLEEQKQQASNWAKGILKA